MTPVLAFADHSVRLGHSVVHLRFGFNAFAAFEAEAGRSAFATIGQLEAGRLEFAGDLRRLCWAAMLHHQPGASLEDAGLVLDADPTCVHRALALAMPQPGEGGDPATAKKPIASMLRRFWPRGSRWG